jgi:hypothetical protein
MYSGRNLLLINKSELVNKIMHKISAKYKFVEWMDKRSRISKPGLPLK